MHTFKKDDILTIIGISSFMATTTRTTYRATGEEHEGKPVFKENKPRVRKKFTLRTPDVTQMERDQLVFVSSNGKNPFPLPLDSEVTVKSDSYFETTSYRGNACINIVGDPLEIRALIESGNINKNFSRYDSVLAIEGEKETPVYPEVETSHAVVQRIREKLTA